MIKFEIVKLAPNLVWSIPLIFAPSVRCPRPSQLMNNELNIQKT